MPNSLKTVKDFVDACASLSSEEIYSLFENTISEELRDHLLYFADADAREPVRYVFNKLGNWSGIQSLIAY